MSTAATQPATPALDLAVIDYGMGNLRSVLRAFERVGGKPRLVSSPAEAKTADALVFPGQGAIMDCMRLLQETKLDNTIREWIAADRPFFGVCLGLQALFEFSEESDDKNAPQFYQDKARNFKKTPGLGIFPGEVVRFRLDSSYKVPHMGWNNVRFTSPAIAPAGSLPGGDQYYFVHSYYARPADRSLVWGETDYGGAFTSAIRRGNCFATQFHPEKSQAKGLDLYRNFLTWAARSKATK